MTLAAMNTGSPTLSNRQEVTSAGGQPETSAHKKLRKAAQEFEGMLISQLLGEFQMGFSSLSGDSPLAGSETLNSLAVQTLSNAMAGRGGFGIGKMLVHQLEPSLNRGQ
jgi:Rod binding domain-containing protein